MITFFLDTSRLLTYASQLPTSDDDDLENMDQFALMMAEDTELEAMDETSHGEFEMAQRKTAACDSFVVSRDNSRSVSVQAEKHRRIIEAAKRKKNTPEHYSLPDAFGIILLLC